MLFVYLHILDYSKGKRKGKVSSGSLCMFIFSPVALATELILMNEVAIEL